MLEQISMSTVGDSTLPLGDTPLLGQYQFSTPEKTAKHKREEGNEKEDEKKTKAELRTKKQVIPGEILEVVNDLMVDDDVEVGREENFNAISSEYGDDLLKASADQTTVVSVEEQTLEVEKTKDKANQASADQTTDVSIEEHTIKVAQTEVVISHQEDDTKKSKEEVEQNKEEVFKGKDDDDGIQRINPEQLVLIESEVDVTLKKRLYAIYRLLV
ncbi:hypothetical protein GIB67_017264 [Kingdonia uniflora]|uniref:Uncharacterized protein n=1 Tax=Kingdonia uniflora TaxID=39325 RepID=A0A7J7L6R1_9MAGN|nr:hypothetical protein GIB67_017264 [Kingdonia uniflora]